MDDKQYAAQKKKINALYAKELSCKMNVDHFSNMFLLNIVLFSLFLALSALLLLMSLKQEVIFHKFIFGAFGILSVIGSIKSLITVLSAIAGYERNKKKYEIIKNDIKDFKNEFNKKRPNKYYSL